MRALIVAAIVVAVAVAVVPGKTLEAKEEWAKGFALKQAEKGLEAISSYFEGPPQASPTKPVSTASPVAPQKASGKVTIESRTPRTNQVEKGTLEEINRERAARGLKPLVWDDKVAEMARLKSIEALETRVFSHKSPRYGYADDMLLAAGIQLGTASEVAGEYAGDSEMPKKAVGGWMNSPPHRRIILSEDFERIGIGVARASEIVMVDAGGPEPVPTRWMYNALLYTPAK